MSASISPDSLLGPEAPVDPFLAARKLPLDLVPFPVSPRLALRCFFCQGVPSIPPLRLKSEPVQGSGLVAAELVRYDPELADMAESPELLWYELDAPREELVGG